MRFLNKYKIHGNYTSASKKLPLRVLKFKRTKWAKIKTKIRPVFKRRVSKWSKKNTFLNKKYNKNFNKKNTFNNNKRKKPAYLDLLRVSISLRGKFFLNKYFLTKLQTKKYVSSLYDNAITLKTEKKQKYKRNLLCYNIVKPLFRIDILLWYLNFFISSFSARLLINSGYIFINNKTVKPNYCVKKGDIISFDLPENCSSYLEVQSKYQKIRKFFPFLEYDYYTNTFIVLKDWEELEKNDFALLFSEIRKFQYLSKK